MYGCRDIGGDHLFMWHRLRLFHRLIIIPADLKGGKSIVIGEEIMITTETIIGEVMEEPANYYKLILEFEKAVELLPFLFSSGPDIDVYIFQIE